MRKKSWGIGALALSGAIVLAACGGGGSADVDPGGQGTTVVNDSGEERQDRANSRSGDSSGVIVEELVDQSPPPQVGDADRALFLPVEATVTEFGDEIIRSEIRPFYGRRWRIDWGVRLVEFIELTPGGPPRDGIPSIDQPRFFSTADARASAKASSPVIQFEVNGDVRAYPLDILIWHEIVNDVVGGIPVAVTYCPLCNTAIAYDRRVEGKTFEFGVSGLLRNSDLVMYDRSTESLWQQIGGKAIVGSMVGARLTPLAAPIVSLGQFAASFPDGLVMSRETGFSAPYGRLPGAYVGYDTDDTPFLFNGDRDNRLDATARVVALEAGGEPIAYPFSLLEEVGAFNDVRGGEELVVFWIAGAQSALDSSDLTESRDVGSTGVFRRGLNGQTLTFEPNPNDPGVTFIDIETGSVWNIFGKAVAGELAGSELEAVIHGNHFWFSWSAFEPDVTLITTLGTP